MSRVSYGQHLGVSRQTPQSMPIPGREREMTKNNAGGYAFEADDWARLRRFLVLGAPAGHYTSERKNVLENAEVVRRCLANDPKQTIQEIYEVSVGGKAPKVDPQIAALAIAACDPDPEVRWLALLALNHVCRTASHLFAFCDLMKQMKGVTKVEKTVVNGVETETSRLGITTGRMFRRAVQDWYAKFDVEGLSYQLAKFQSREGFSHKDLLKVCHVPFGEGEARQAACRWAMGWEYDPLRLPDYLAGVEAAKRAQTPKEVAQVVRRYRLTHESVPSQFLEQAEVWDALLECMPVTAMLKSLGRMTANGCLKPLSKAADLVVAALSDADKLRKARLHPLNALVSLKYYARGCGEKGDLRWAPVHAVVDALDRAYDLAFGSLQPAGKRFLLALDVSGSMDTNQCVGLPLTAREMAGCLAMAVARVEPRHHFVAFTDAMHGRGGPLNWADYRSPERLGLTDPGISSRMRLDEVCRTMRDLPMGGTDCALPFVEAAKRGWEVDCFVVITDNETWAGNVQPAQALADYRRRSGIKAKAVFLATSATGFQLADPKDPFMLDMGGASLDVPAVISEFSKL